jgi:predicted permease
MTPPAPRPLRPLMWLLRTVSSRDAARAAIGDATEELGERRAAGLAPRYPALWMNVQTMRTIAMESSAASPRLFRTTGLLLRDAFRAVRAAPVQSLFIVFVLAAGITLGTVTFSVVDAVVLKPLPIERPEQLVRISTTDESFKQRITSDVFWRLHDELQSTEGIAGRMVTTGVMATVDAVTDQVSVTYASADIFRILRLSPAIGRFWTTDDDARGVSDVAVLGYRFWREQLGGDPSVLGKTVSIGKRTYTVIGVLSAASDHPEVDITTSPIWVPTLIPRTPINAPMSITARMRPGVTTSQVADEIQRIAGTPDWRPTVRPVLDAYVSQYRSWMLLALGAAALVVLVACANAANLMLTRAAGRVQEMAIRAALGASRLHIASAVMTEGLLLAVAATAGALLLSIAGVRLAKLAVATALPGMFRASAIALNGRVFVAAIACAAVTGVLCSLVPAWQTSRAPVALLLKDTEGPTATGRRRWRSVFLVTEIATVVVLLVVSWLFVVSLIHVNAIDLGLDRNNLLAVSARIEFQGTVDEVRERVQSVPGVSDVAVSTVASLPLIGRAYGGAWITTTVQRAEGGAGTGVGTGLKVLEYRVTPNYFAVAGLRFLRGGTWAADPAAGPSAVVLDEQAARKLFGDENPLGQQVAAKEPAGIFTVVGTVPHVYALGAEEDNWPSAYFALKPNPARKFAGLFVRTSRPARDMLPLVTEVLKPVGPLLREPFVFIADEAVRRITATRRFNAQLMSVFGVVGMLIGAAGVYAVMASFVAQQTREIGVRVALGATPAHIRRGVLGLAWRHLLAGLALGVPIAWWLSRGFSALLFQVTPADVSVYAGVATLLCATGVLAAWIPARRAARLDPILSLRR